MPFRHAQDNTKMRYRYIVTVHRVGAARGRAGSRVQVADQLVTKKIKIDPVSVAAALATTEGVEVKVTGLGEVVNGNGEVEWLHGGGVDEVVVGNGGIIVAWWAV